MSEDGLEGKNPTKWHWEKGSWRWGLANIEALQNGSGIFICFIRSWMHWFDHFLTKLSIYLWIKAGDRHYHFAEPWVIDRPFCRMETLYRSHFVEKGLVHYKMGHPNPTQGMEGGSLDIYTLHVSSSRASSTKCSEDAMMKTLMLGQHCLYFGMCCDKKRLMIYAE